MEALNDRERYEHGNIPHDFELSVAIKALQEYIDARTLER